MEEILLNYNYWSIFLISFLASTILPLGSEWLLVALIVKGLNPFLLVALASIGNFLGGYTTYLIGLYGSSYFINKILRISDNQRKKSEKIYSKYGSWSLLFSWVPVIGDPLCFMGGVMKVNFFLFFLFVFTGKLVRYIFVAVITFQLNSP